jgi:hypothetical protein
MKAKQIVRLNDFMRVLNVMQQYNRTDGYIRFDGDVVNFYDGCVNGSAFITIQQVKQAIKDYEQAINEQ